MQWIVFVFIHTDTRNFTCIFAKFLLSYLKRKFVMAVNMKGTFFWNMTTYRLVEAYKRFEGAYCYHLKGQSMMR